LAPCGNYNEWICAAAAMWPVASVTVAKMRRPCCSNVCPYSPSMSEGKVMQSVVFCVCPSVRMFPLELLTFTVDTVHISMRQGLCNHTRSPGVRRVCCCRPGEQRQQRAGGRLAVVAPHQHGPQCHVYSRRRRLNTDLFACVWIITIANRGLKVKVTGQEKVKG